MKIRCKQADGEIGLNGTYWTVENHVADVPDDAAAILLDRYSDNFGVYEETIEEES
jgi:hypothetical protein